MTAAVESDITGVPEDMTREGMPADGSTVAHSQPSSAAEVQGEVFADQALAASLGAVGTTYENLLTDLRDADALNLEELFGDTIPTLEDPWITQRWQVGRSVVDGQHLPLIPAPKTAEQTQPEGASQVGPDTPADAASAAHTTEAGDLYPDAESAWVNPQNVAQYDQWFTPHQLPAAGSQMSFRPRREILAELATHTGPLSITSQLPALPGIPDLPLLSGPGSELVGVRPHALEAALSTAEPVEHGDEADETFAGDYDFSHDIAENEFIETELPPEPGATEVAKNKFLQPTLTRIAAVSRRLLLPGRSTPPQD